MRRYGKNRSLPGDQQTVTEYITDILKTRKPQRNGNRINNTVELIIKMRIRPCPYLKEYKLHALFHYSYDQKRKNVYIQIGVLRNKMLQYPFPDLLKNNCYDRGNSSCDQKFNDQRSRLRINMFLTVYIYQKNYRGQDRSNYINYAYKLI